MVIIISSTSLEPTQSPDTVKQARTGMNAGIDSYHKYDSLHPVSFMESEPAVFHSIKRTMRWGSHKQVPRTIKRQREATILNIVTMLDQCNEHRYGHRSLLTLFNFINLRTTIREWKKVIFQVPLRMPLPHVFPGLLQRTTVLIHNCISMDDLRTHDLNNCRAAWRECPS